MPVDTTHAGYDHYLPSWKRAREAIEGEEAVKLAGETYLPRLEGQTDAEYLAYVGRASFFNAVGRTLDGFAGMIFRRDPRLKLPEGDGLPGVGFGKLLRDADLLGTNLLDYARSVTTEVLAVGRAGTLVEWSDEEARPFFVRYRPEDILNWKMQRVGGEPQLVLVVLAELAEGEGEGLDVFEDARVPQIRVLRLVPGQGYHVELWRKVPKGQKGAAAVEPGMGVVDSPGVVVQSERSSGPVFLPGTGDAAAQGEWTQLRTLQPKRRGERLMRIPFVFHGPEHSRPDPQKLPMQDIIAKNFTHYRVDADYHHGMHFSALPTAWVAGFDKAAVLKLGSTVAWVTENADAKAEFLEFRGQGLATLERAMDRDERLMAVLGSRMIETPKRVSESAEALALRKAGESSVVANIASSVSQSLTLALRWAYWWLSSEAQVGDVPVETVSLALNRDYDVAGLSAEELTALVAAWQTGLMSHDSALNRLREGEILPEGRTNEEERELIAAQPPPMLRGSALDGDGDGLAGEE